MRDYDKVEIRIASRRTRKSEEPQKHEPGSLGEDEEECKERIPIVDIVRQDAKNMPDVYRRLRRGF
jgi:hypothetical protein